MTPAQQQLAERVIKAVYIHAHMDEETFDTDRIRTTMQAAAAKSGQSVDAMIDKRRAGIPAQRMGTADEFGAFCAFLCSAQAGYLTGQNILLDGGAYPGTF